MPNVFQIGMGWDDENLHQFRIRGKRFGIAKIGGITFNDDPDFVSVENLVCLERGTLRPEELGLTLADAKNPLNKALHPKVCSPDVIWGNCSGLESSRPLLYSVHPEMANLPDIGVGRKI